ncbi:hypothetical protein HanIR_Chr12g0586321 [Helianthus annuus]|nr:hypothetical protein HanIR_Chr12g0586321 [Helianthus annuus]
MYPQHHLNIIANTHRPRATNLHLQYQHRSYQPPPTTNLNHHPPLPKFKILNTKTILLSEIN